MAKFLRKKQAVQGQAPVGSGAPDLGQIPVRMDIPQPTYLGDTGYNGYNLPPEGYNGQNSQYSADTRPNPPRGQHGWYDDDHGGSNYAPTPPPVSVSPRIDTGGTYDGNNYQYGAGIGSYHHQGVVDEPNNGDYSDGLKRPHPPFRPPRPGPDSQFWSPTPPPGRVYPSNENGQDFIQPMAHSPSGPDLKQVDVEHGTAASGSGSASGETTGFWKKLNLNTRRRAKQLNDTGKDLSKKRDEKRLGLFRPNETLPVEVEQAGASGAPLRFHDHVLVSKRGDPFNGSWYPLDVMTTYRGHNSYRNAASWSRHKMKNDAPLWVRLVDWPWRPKQDPERDEDVDFGGTPRGTWEIIGRAFLAWLGLLIVAYLPMEVAPIKLPYRFAPLLYSYTGYAKTPKNPYEKEGRKFLDHEEKSEQEEEVSSVEEHLRTVWPSMLAELAEPESKEPKGYMLYEYSKRMDDDYMPAPSLPPPPGSAIPGDRMQPIPAAKDKRLPSYLFVSYASRHFNSGDDMNNLKKTAEHLARQHGLDAFWLSSMHIQPDEGEDHFSSEVYKMSDIVRSASEVVIILPPNSGQALDAALEEWGSRVWTFPEVLLSKNSEISVYIAPVIPRANGRAIHWGSVKMGSPRIMNKYALAEKAWPGDVRSARQLVDHFLGTIHLSRLELSLLALRCMRAREFEQMLEGDISYVIMGLQRNRPQVDRDPKDTPFQAFARLSLSNDSDRLLERAISLQTPENERHSWLSLKDEFGCNLWDIEPECQIAAVCDDDTVILDGAHGAAIRWNSFPKELSYVPKDVVSFVLNASFALLITGLSLLVTAQVPGSGGQKAGGGVLLAFAILLTFLGPLFISIRLATRFTPPQPWLIGFEGHLSLDSMERLAFGRVYKQLRWSAHGSTMSVHTRCDHFGKGKRVRKLRAGFSQCVGLDPASEPKIRSIIDRADGSESGADKVFTIIDTVSMQATLIRARKPPVAAIACGTEGGMKRVILCSYDIACNTLQRETVMRLETPTVEKMFCVNRFKFGYGVKYSAAELNRHASLRNSRTGKHADFGLENETEAHYN